MTERGGAMIFCRMSSPPSPDATILNYLDDRERGRHNLGGIEVALNANVIIDMDITFKDCKFETDTKYFEI